MTTTWKPFNEPVAKCLCLCHLARQNCGDWEEASVKCNFVTNTVLDEKTRLPPSLHTYFPTFLGSRQQHLLGTMAWSFRSLLSFLLLPYLCTGLNNFPTTPIRSVIQRAAETTKDAVTQMQMIRRILEDIYGGTWGVLVIRNPALVSKEVHWTFPDHTNSDGSPAFCLAVVNQWQYNVFKTGQVDSPQRVTIDNIIQRFSSGTLPKMGKLGTSKNKEKFLDLESVKQPPRRYSIAQLDRMLSGVLEENQRMRSNRSPKLVN